MSSTALSILRGLIFIVPAILHSIGIFLLSQGTKRKQLNGVSYIFLFALSASELAYCILAIIECPFYVHDLNSSTVFYIELFKNGTIFVYILLVMIIITVDRFLIAYYNVRYTEIWNLKKALFVVIFPMVTCIVLFLVIALTHSSYDAIRETFSLYIWIIGDYVNLVIFVLTYVYILKKYGMRRSKRSIRPTSINNKPLQEVETSEDKRRKIMYTSFIITFIVFVVVPDQISFVLAINGHEVTQIVDFFLTVMYMVGLCLDAVIYVWCLKI